MNSSESVEYHGLVPGTVRGTSDESFNPYQPPLVVPIGEFQLAKFVFRLTVLLASIVLLACTGYGLFGTIANGYEMAREFSNWRLRAEIELVTLFGTGIALCFLLNHAVRRQSILRVACVLVSAVPGLLYVVFDLI